MFLCCCCSCLSFVSRLFPFFKKIKIKSPFLYTLNVCMKCNGKATNNRSQSTTSFLCYIHCTCHRAARKKKLLTSKELNWGEKTVYGEWDDVSVNIYHHSSFMLSFCYGVRRRRKRKALRTWHELDFLGILVGVGIRITNCWM